MSSFIKSLLNAVTDSTTSQTAPSQGQDQAPGLARIAQIAMQNPQLMQVAAAMLTASNKHGGLAGMLQKFTQAGLGEKAQSWVDQGENAPLSGREIEEVFGREGIDRIAQKAGVERSQAPDLLSQILPQLINGLTQGGRPPAQAPQSADALLGMLGGLFGKR